MFNKILIANRGEIACRIIGTARAHGVRTVAVYSEVDKQARHVSLADEAMCVGPASVSESYLRSDRIIEAALATGAEAIHPGYGFLSENPEFVEQINTAGLVFIGPGADSIRAMGLKDAAKKLMQQANVPVVPGYHGDNQDAQFLKAQATDIGYPVLIKARAGGGGKGMRLVEKESDFIASLESAQREAQAGFADASCLIEKYITSPRHIEIQVFGDSQGNVVHLFERDCSLQRRHQKVIEEAPAPGMNLEMREAMGKAAVEAARAISYAGAGTVEFIVDSSDGLRPDRFWFMEMNTRLQVEHPVTEAITGCDLVEWQLRVASGEPLPKTQDQLSINGCSMEARIYAEDVSNGFLPATGTLHHLQFPATARVDTGVRQGDTISPFYDPMIAKLTVHGADRAAALRKMTDALRGCHSAGSVTNVNFLGRLINHKDFVSGDVHTGLIDRNLTELIQTSEPPTAVIAMAALECSGIDNSQPFTAFSLWQPLLHTVNLIDENQQHWVVKIAGETANSWRITINDSTHTMQINSEDSCDFDGVLMHLPTAAYTGGVSVFAQHAWHFSVPDALDGNQQQEAAGDHITSPMPGQIKVVDAVAGATVAEGDTLVVMEAMKMEHTLLAPRDGIIEEVTVAVADQVEAGAILIRLVKDD